MIDLYENLTPYRELVRRKKEEELLLAQAEADAEAANKRVNELSSMRNNVRDPYKKIGGLSSGKNIDSVENIDDGDRGK